MTERNTLENPAATLVANGQHGQFLPFALGKEEYGIQAHAVQELRSYDNVTAFPNAPEFIKGVINLRGSIVPIIDMRIKFGLKPANYDRFTVVILSVDKRTIGIVVDSVSGAVTLGEGDIKPPPTGTALNAELLIGLATIDQRMIVLIDVEKLVAGIGIVSIAKLAGMP